MMKVMTFISSLDEIQIDDKKDVVLHKKMIM